MSQLGKTLRIAAKAKAQARVGKAIRARKAYLPELHEAQKSIKKVKARDDGGKVDGVQAQVRSDRKPRTAKAWGGSLTPEDVDAAIAAVQQKPGIASQIAGAFRPGMIGRTMGPAAAAATPRWVPPAPFSQSVGQMAANMGAVGAGLAGTVLNPPRRFPLRPTPALERDVPERRGDPGSGMLPRDEPTMVITARRPEPDRPVARAAPSEAMNADRLNAISAGQSRVGPPAADEVPRGAVEEAAARNMAARRALIESTDTLGGVEGTFKRGGKAKAKKKAR